MDKRDPMSQYSSVPKKHGSLIKPGEKIRNNPEQTEQLKFCKAIKHKYPDVLFRSDMQADKHKTPYMQNLKQILDPFRGWPDTVFYEPRKQYCGLMIEMKCVDSGVYLKGGELSKDAHIREQHDFHVQLRQKGWLVWFARGADEAMQIFEDYYFGRI